MSSYRYRINVQALPASPDTEEPQPSFQFETTMHDDLVRIVDIMQKSHIVEEESAVGLAVGLKLFAEVVIRNRKNPNFTPFEAPLRQFIGMLKQAKPQ